MNPADELNDLITDGTISEAALTGITGMQTEKLEAFLNQTGSGITRNEEPKSLSPDETMKLSTLAGQLTWGFQIGDNDRLRGMLESLTAECCLTLRNIAKITGLAVEDLESALRDPQAVPETKKYQLALRVSYLVSACNQARS